MRKRLSFTQVALLALAVAFILGIVLFLLLGATTNKGTTGAIAAEYTKIVAAEKQSCREHGSYGSVATLRKEGLLTFKPVYNSVVYLPGRSCGTFVVGSAAYQS